MPTHSEVIAGVVAEQGVEFVFGLPGGEIVAFNDACRRAGMRFLLTGHESSAVLMAQIIGQITGIPGVCTATLGPGATNMVTGVANALLERSPVLAVTAQIPNQFIDTMSHQRLDLNALFAPITKNSVTVKRSNTAELTLNALALTVEPRPGPVHLALPSDLATAECSSSGNKNPQAEARRSNHESAASYQLSEVASRLLASERPLLIVGLGVPLSAAPYLKGLIEALQAPFLVTPKAKGIVREDHPLFLGVASGMAIDRDVVETIRLADLVIGIGFDPVECDKTWFAEVDIVSIDSTSMAEGSYRPSETLGDIVSLLTQLIPKISRGRSWPSKLLGQRRMAIQRSPRNGERGVSPLGLLEGLRLVFPENGLVTCDVGSHKLLMGQFWRSYVPGTFFMSNGLSGMGFGLPAAIAAQLARPDRSVLAVVGDGGMLMMLHDLVLIRELSLPIIIVVMVDRSLSLIRVSMERRGLPSLGVNFVAPDFVAVASGFGIHGERAISVANAKLAVERALVNRTSLLLEVPVDLREYYDLV